MKSILIKDTTREERIRSMRWRKCCSREVIERGATQLGWELEKLLTMTLQAMAATEDEIQVEMEAYSA